MKLRNYDSSSSSRQDSVVGIATGYVLDESGGRSSILHVGSGVQPTSYPMGTGGSFPVGKAAEV
jgi:hypothetical protein